MKRAALCLAMLLSLSYGGSGCRGRETAGNAEKAGEERPAGKAESSADIPTPVRIATIDAIDLADVVAGPGHTAALSQQKVRAPFAGTIVALTVSDGDFLRRGQVVGAIVSRESEAALSGAREMAHEAQTPAQKSDAERALVLAESGLVRKPLAASADGPVLSHAAASGDRVAEDQEILTIADASSIVFLADVSQSDLPRIRPGEPVRVELAGRAAAVAGRVHGILPGANPADFSGSVRVDLPAAAERLATGLFGTARITVGTRPGVFVAPASAVMRDDVRSTSQMAAVVQGRAHWIPVRTGARQGDLMEVSGPDVKRGLGVVVSGMVGLPEGKSVAASPSGTASEEK